MNTLSRDRAKLRVLPLTDFHLAQITRERRRLPLEKILRNIFRVYFLRPKRRPYETNNFYAVLERQEKLDEEVKQIVQKANTRGQKSNRGRNRKGEAAGR